MLTRRRFLALTGVTGIAAAGLAVGYQLLPAGDEGQTDGPPTIALGSDSCSHCKMVISDGRFAAAWREPGGRTERFDDIGCMVGMYHDMSPANGTGYWVHSYNDESPFEAEGAHFLVAHAIVTPMAFGIAAVATAPEADALAGQFEAERHTWASLLASQDGGH